jgi:uncharacterized SAM-binding protein YcdF (DUF218 family)
MERRMQVAISLYRAGVAPLMLLSGGGDRAVPEADVMRGLAIAAGVPESALLLEPDSRNTQENATHATALLGARRVTDIFLVTDRYHAVRARLLFRLAGLAVRSVHVAPMSPRRRTAMLVTESLKLPLSLAHALWHRAARAIRA